MSRTRLWDFGYNRRKVVSFLPHPELGHKPGPAPLRSFTNYSVRLSI
jgi:hypothetical protein